MQITCPDCSARYLVKPSAIGENGRRVKCTRCKSMWFQEPMIPVAEQPKTLHDEPVETHAIPDGGNVPALQKTKTPAWHKGAFAASLVLFFVTLTYSMGHTLLHSAPWLAGYYKIFNIYESEGVGISDVAMDQVQDGKKLKLILTGKLVNTTDEVKPMPMLRVTVYNQHDKALTKASLTPAQNEIEPQGHTEFYNMIPAVSSNAARVVLDVGDSLALKKR